MSISIEMNGITKRYGDVIANDAIDIRIESEAGKILAIVGENGAGKSTLMKILYGDEIPDAGDIIIDGERVNLTNPSDAIRLGIGMVYQHFTLLQSCTVLENVALGSEPVKFGVFVDYSPVRERIEKILMQLNISLNLDNTISTFSIEDQQVIEIVKALYRGARILILDEPTAVLTPQKIENLLEIMRTLKQSGNVIILITHKLDEALAVSDEIAVLRDGRHVATVPRSQATKDNIVEMMIGEGQVIPVSDRTESVQSSLLSIRSLCVEGQKKRLVDDISFDVHQGEIFGITGVGGNGQDELVEAIVGLRTCAQGEIQFKNVVINELDIHCRRELGMAYVPSDRIRDGLAVELPVLDNLILGHHLRKPIKRGMILDYRRASDLGGRLIDRYGILARGLSWKALGLSGGNLQKLVIAREFEFYPDLFLISHPSRGIDIRTIHFVHDEIIRRRNEGVGILMVSGDLDEIMALSDRIGVMYRGQLTFITKPDRTTRKELGMYMTGSMEPQSVESNG
jgi:simple sugar transport system ATP-binding protein